MKKQNDWKDHYTERARKEKWPARSVYKLEEIDKKHDLIHSGFRIMDLGCYPGSWSQYCLKKVGKKGEVFGLDLKEPEGISAENFKFLKTDIFKLDNNHLAVEFNKMDAVISDMAPNTTGIKVADTARSLELCEKAFEIALITLKKNGHFLCKVFEGGDLKLFKDQVATCFTRTRILRPSAVRKRSKEIYLLGLKLV